MPALSVIRQFQPPQAHDASPSGDDLELQRPEPAHIRSNRSDSPDLIEMDEFLRSNDPPAHLSSNRFYAGMDHAPDVSSEPDDEEENDPELPSYTQANQPPAYDEANPPPNYQYGWQSFKKTVKDHPIALGVGTVILTLMGTLLGISIKNSEHQQTR